MLLKIPAQYLISNLKSSSRNNLGNKPYPSGRENTRPVRISSGLYELIELILKTEKARLLGFRFMSDVINTAVRDFMTTYGFQEDVEKFSTERSE